MNRTVRLENFCDMRYFMTYYDLDMNSPLNTNGQHIHDEYEVYINLSGAVNFVCEDNIYPVGPGNVVINRPGEAHHCVYRKNISHKHYWMLFTCPADEPLLKVFHERPLGVGNLITLTEEHSAELIQLCAELSSEHCEGTLETAYRLIRLLMLLNGGMAGKNTGIPSGIQDALTYISHHISCNVSVKDLAESAHMSLSAFERNFATYVGMTPKQYITQRRLVLAAERLSGGCSVSEAYEACGFADYSHFISLFGKRFGMTPLGYRRAHYNEDINHHSNSTSKKQGGT